MNEVNNASSLVTQSSSSKTESTNHLCLSIADSDAFRDGENGDKKKKNDNNHDDNHINNSNNDIDEEDEEDETYPIIHEQLDNKLYLYQNLTTGMASSTPLSCRQLCRILCPPTTGATIAATNTSLPAVMGTTSSLSTSSSSSMVNHLPLNGDTMVIGIDPVNQSYSKDGWMPCRCIPILREAFSRWHYQDAAVGGGGGIVKGPVSARVLSELVISSRRTSQGVRTCSEGGDGGGGGSRHLTENTTRVWSAEIAAASAAGGAGEGEKNIESQWRTISSDINLRICLEAFRTTTMTTGKTLNTGKSKKGMAAVVEGSKTLASSFTSMNAQVIQNRDHQQFDTSVMTYNDDYDDDNDGTDMVTGTAWACEQPRKKAQDDDDLDSFFASHEAAAATGDGKEKKAEDEEDDEDENEDEEGFESDGGTSYIKCQNTGEWMESSAYGQANEKKKKTKTNVRSIKVVSGKPHENYEKDRINDAIGTKPENTNNSDCNKKRKKKKKKRAQFAARNAAKWIYVTGLPDDTDEDEVASVFSKAGIIDLDPETQMPKIKLYRHKKKDNVGDDDGGGRSVVKSVVGMAAETLKGDASICYARSESVDLAIQVLDGYLFRPTSNEGLVVSRAKFEQKGYIRAQDDDKDGGAVNSGNDKRRYNRVSEAKRKIARLAAVQAVDWDEGEGGRISAGRKGLRIIVLKHMFTLDMIKSASNKDEDEVLNTIERKLRLECEDKFGSVEKITIFSKNPRGIVVIKFKQPPSATAAVKEFHGRRLGGRRDGNSDNNCYAGPERKIEATFWDGVTDYSSSIQNEEEEANDTEKRQEEFGQWLDSQELPEEFRLKVES